MSLAEVYRQGTQLHSRGRFSLDESRARDKMARFQLSDPEHFLLLLAQACVASGGHRLDISILEQTFSVIGLGMQLSSERMQRLDDFLFDLSSSTVAYHLLAVALGAVEEIASEPVEVNYEDGSLVLQFRTEHRFFNLKTLLAERFRHYPLTWQLDGEQQQTQELGSHPVFEWHQEDHSEITLVRYGVVVSVKRPKLNYNFRTVARDDDLAMDASYSEVIENEHYELLLARLQGQALSLLAEEVSEHPPDGPRVPEFRQLLLKPPGEPVNSALRRAPLFPLAQKEGFTDHLTLEQVVKQTGELQFSAIRFSLEVEQLVVWADKFEVLSILYDLFGENRLKNAEPDYRQLVKVKENYDRWLSSPRPLELPPGGYHFDRSHSGSGWKARLGLQSSASFSVSRLNVHYQGRFLATEDLLDTPPGSLAVVDFQEVDLLEDWTGATGAKYRAALESIRKKIQALFDKLKFKQEDLNPTLEAYLWREVGRRNPVPPVVDHSELLLPVRPDGIRCLVDLGPREKIHLIESTELCSKIPQTALPRTLVLSNPAKQESLTKILGEKKVVDFREEALRLSELEEALRKPWFLPPLRAGHPKMSTDLQGPGWHARVGLVPDSSNTRLRVTLLRGRAEIEVTALVCTKVCGGSALLVSDLFELSCDWRKVKRNRQAKKVLAQFRKQLSEFESGLLDCSSVPLSVRRELLLTQPERFEEFADTPLFSSNSHRDRLLSLNQLRKDLNEHGHLLQGSPGVQFTARVMLSNRISELEKSLLSRMLKAPLALLDGDKLVQKEQRRATFFGIEPLPEIKVRQYPENRYQDPAHFCPGLWRRNLKSARGELVIRPLHFLKNQGQVDLYLQGRYVSRRTDVFPGSWRAAVESDLFQLNDTCSDVEIPEAFWSALREELASVYAQGLLALLRSGDLEARIWVWRSMIGLEQSESVRNSLLSYQGLQLQGGQETTLGEFLADRRSLPYVIAEDFPRNFESSQQVLRIPQACKDGVLALAGLPGRCMLRKLREEQAKAEWRLSIPEQAPQGAFRQAFKLGSLQAEIVLLSERRAILFDDSGKPELEYLWSSLPARVLISGLKTPTRGSGGHLGALEAQQRVLLENWTAETYLNWLMDLDQRGFSEGERRLAVKALASLKWELSDLSPCPFARLAHKLWRLPLFLRVDGSRQCGASLLMRFRELETPILVTEHCGKGPPSALVVERNSPAHDILETIFEDNGIQWYHNPVQFRLQKARQTASRLISWGLTSPRSSKDSTKEAVTGSAESDLAAETQQPPVTPEERFLAQLHQELLEITGEGAPNLEYLEQTEIKSWPLGPPVYLNHRRENENEERRITRLFKVGKSLPLLNGISKLVLGPVVGGQTRFNRLHRSVRWLCENHHDSPQKRVGRILLVLYWLSLIQQAEGKFSDASTKEGFPLENKRLLREKFINKLTERSLGIFGGAES